MQKDRQSRQTAQRMLWEGLIVPRRGRRYRLTEADIVSAAFVVAQRAGIYQLTMSAVADELGVGVASLYAHVPNKAGLLALMSDTMIGLLPLPHIVAGNWREQTEAWALDEMAAFRAYPWLAEFNGLHTVGPKAVAWLDSAVRVFESTGLTADEAITVVNAVSALILGHVPLVLTEDQSQGSSQTTGDHSAARAQEFRKSYLFADDHYPALESLTEYPSAMDTFEAGLSWLLDGVATQIAGRHRQT